MRGLLACILALAGAAVLADAGAPVPQSAVSRVERVERSDMRFLMLTIGIQFNDTLAVGGTLSGGTVSGSTPVTDLSLEKACNDFPRGTMDLQGIMTLTCPTVSGEYTFGTIPVDDGVGGGDPGGPGGDPGGGDPCAHGGCGGGGGGGPGGDDDREEYTPATGALEWWRSERFHDYPNLNELNTQPGVMPYAGWTWDGPQPQWFLDAAANPDDPIVPPSDAGARSFPDWGDDPSNGTLTAAGSWPPKPLNWDEDWSGDLGPWPPSTDRKEDVEDAVAPGIGWTPVNMNLVDGAGPMEEMAPLYEAGLVNATAAWDYEDPGLEAGVTLVRPLLRADVLGKNPTALAVGMGNFLPMTEIGMGYVAALGDPEGGIPGSWTSGMFSAVSLAVDMPDLTGYSWWEADGNDTRAGWWGDHEFGMGASNDPFDTGYDLPQNFTDTYAAQMVDWVPLDRDPAEYISLVTGGYAALHGMFWSDWAEFELAHPGEFPTWADSGLYDPGDEAEFEPALAGTVNFMSENWATFDFARCIPEWVPTWPPSFATSQRVPAMDSETGPYYAFPVLLDAACFQEMYLTGTIAYGLGEDVPPAFSLGIGTRTAPYDPEVHTMDAAPGFNPGVELSAVIAQFLSEDLLKGGDDPQLRRRLASTATTTSPWTPGGSGFPAARANAESTRARRLQPATATRGRRLQSAGCGPAGCADDSTAAAQRDYKGDCFDSGAPLMYAMAPLTTESPMATLFGVMGDLDRTWETILDDTVSLGIILEFWEEEQGTLGGLILEDQLDACTVRFNPEGSLGINPITQQRNFLSSATSGLPVSSDLAINVTAAPVVCNHTAYAASQARLLELLEQPLSTVTDAEEGDDFHFDDYEAIDRVVWQVTAIRTERGMSECRTKFENMLTQESQEITRRTKRCGKPRLVEVTSNSTDDGSGSDDFDDDPPIGRRLSASTAAPHTLRSLVSATPPAGTRKPESRFAASLRAQLSGHATRLATDTHVHTGGKPHGVAEYFHRRAGEAYADTTLRPLAAALAGGASGGSGGRARRLIEYDDAPELEVNTDWLDDPCCNWEAQFESCCTARPISFARTAVTGVDEDTVAAQCDAASLQTALDTLTLLGEDMNRAGSGDASTDRCARFASSGRDAIEDRMKWYRDCVEELHEEKDCTRNADCPSGQCDDGRGKCQVPWQNPPLMASIFAACLLDPVTSDPQVLTRVKTSLGLPASATDTTFAAAVAEASLGDEDCVGHTAWETPGATGTWTWEQDLDDCDPSVEYCPWVNTYVPGNETLCLADRSCNWDRWAWDMNEARCLQGPRGAGGADMCMECWGDPGEGNCWSVTQPSQCAKNDYWGEQSAAQTACEADGLNWMSEWGWGRCENLNATDRASCMAGCPFPDDAQMSWAEEQRTNSWNRCTSTFCTNEATTDQETCDQTSQYSGCTYRVNVTAGEECPPWDEGWQQNQIWAEPETDDGEWVATDIAICSMSEWEWDSRFPGVPIAEGCVPGGPANWTAPSSGPFGCAFGAGFGSSSPWITSAVGASCPTGADLIDVPSSMWPEGNAYDPDAVFCVADPETAGDGVPAQFGEDLEAWCTGNKFFKLACYDSGGTNCDGAVPGWARTTGGFCIATSFDTDSCGTTIDLSVPVFIVDSDPRDVPGPGPGPDPSPGPGPEPPSYAACLLSPGFNVDGHPYCPASTTRYYNPEGGTKPDSIEGTGDSWRQVWCFLPEFDHAQFATAQECADASNVYYSCVDTASSAADCATDHAGDPTWVALEDAFPNDHCVNFALNQTECTDGGFTALFASVWAPVNNTEVPSPSPSPSASASPSSSIVASASPTPSPFPATYFACAMTVAMDSCANDGGFYRADNVIPEDAGWPTANVTWCYSLSAQVDAMSSANCRAADGGTFYHGCEDTSGAECDTETAGWGRTDGGTCVSASHTPCSGGSYSPVTGELRTYILAEDPAIHYDACLFKPWYFTYTGSGDMYCPNGTTLYTDNAGVPPYLAANGLTDRGDTWCYAYAFDHAQFANEHECADAGAGGSVYYGCADLGCNAGNYDTEYPGHDHEWYPPAAGSDRTFCTNFALTAQQCTDGGWVTLGSGTGNWAPVADGDTPATPPSQSSSASASATPSTSVTASVTPSTAQTPTPSASATPSNTPPASATPTPTPAIVDICGTAPNTDPVSGAPFCLHPDTLLFIDGAGDAWCQSTSHAPASCFGNPTDDVACYVDIGSAATDDDECATTMGQADAYYLYYFEFQHWCVAPGMNQTACDGVSGTLVAEGGISSQSRKDDVILAPYAGCSYDAETAFGSGLASCDVDDVGSIAPTLGTTGRDYNVYSGSLTFCMRPSWDLTRSQCEQLVADEVAGSLVSNADAYIGCSIQCDALEGYGGETVTNPALNISNWQRLDGAAVDSAVQCHSGISSGACGALSGSGATPIVATRWVVTEGSPTGAAPSASRTPSATPSPSPTPSATNSPSSSPAPARRRLVEDMWADGEPIPMHRATELTQFLRDLTRKPHPRINTPEQWDAYIEELLRQQGLRRDIKEVEAAWEATNLQTKQHATDRQRRFEAAANRGPSDFMDALADMVAGGIQAATDTVQAVAQALGLTADDVDVQVRVQVHAEPVPSGRPEPVAVSTEELHAQLAASFAQRPHVVHEGAPAWDRREEVARRTAAIRQRHAGAQIDAHSRAVARRLQGGGATPVYFGDDATYNVQHWWHSKFTSQPNPEYNATFAATFQREQEVTDEFGNTYTQWNWDIRAEEWVWLQDDTASGACVTNAHQQGVWNNQGGGGQPRPGQFRDACEALSDNHAYWTGTWYTEGNYHTEPLCDEGRCEVPCHDPAQCYNGRSYNASECAAINRCTRSCEACEQNVPITQGAGLCYRLMASSACESANGEMHDSVERLCTFSLPRDECTEAGHLYYACGDEERDTCNYWDNSRFMGQAARRNKPREALQCEYRWKECESQEVCEAIGECSDRDFESWKDKGNGVSGHVSGACLKPFTQDLNGGGRQCDWEAGWQHRFAGCMNYDFDDADACEADGGTWKVRAKTREECTAHGRGCKEPNWWELTPKSASDCAGCGGHMVDLYEWWGGTWRPAQVTPLHWLPPSWDATNSWVPSLQWHALERVVRQAAAQVEAQNALALQRCRNTRTTKRMATLACACTDTPDDTCGNGVALQVTAVQNLVADTVVPVGTSANIVAGTVGDITVSADAFTEDQVDPDTGVVPITVSETDVFTDGAVVALPNPVAQQRRRLLRSGAGAVHHARHLSDVAQDAIMQVITTGGVLDYGSVNGTQTVPASAIEVCLTVLDTFDGTLDNATFTVFDFATFDTTEFALLSRAEDESVATNITLDGDLLCGLTRHVGTIVGVRRIGDDELDAVTAGAAGLDGEFCYYEAADVADFDPLAFAPGGVDCAGATAMNGTGFPTSHRVQAGTSCTITCSVNSGTTDILPCLINATSVTDLALAWAATNCDATCPAGRVGLDVADPATDDACEPCDEGTASGDGEGACTQCEPGTYAGSTGATACVDCDAGSTATGFGATICTQCLAGRYAASGDPSCSVCTPGTYSSSGAADCTDCDPGSYAPLSNSALCTLCPVGTYINATGSDACLDCPPTAVTPSEGALGCTPCTGGTVASDNRTVCVEPSASPSPSPSPSNTPTPSRTPSRTPSHTRTPSATPSVSPSASVTPTVPLASASGDTWWETSTGIAVMATVGVVVAAVAVFLAVMGGRGALPLAGGRKNRNPVTGGRAGMSSRFKSRAAAPHLHGDNDSDGNAPAAAGSAATANTHDGPWSRFTHWLSGSDADATAAAGAGADAGAGANIGSRRATAAPAHHTPRSKEWKPVPVRGDTSSDDNDDDNGDGSGNRGDDAPPAVVTSSGFPVRRRAGGRPPSRAPPTRRTQAARKASSAPPPISDDSGDDDVA